MRIFVYKTLFIFVCIFILFQLTIGAKIKKIKNEIVEFKSHKNIELMKNKLRDEIKFENIEFLKTPRSELIGFTILISLFLSLK